MGQCLAPRPVLLVVPMFLSTLATKPLHVRVLYPAGTDEGTLPKCDPWSVCNRVDTYSTPWLERQCHCPKGQSCSKSVDPHDGHTIVDRSRQLKVCEPVSQMAFCRYFRDPTWTVVTAADSNRSRQIMHCVCPPGSVAYISNHETLTTPQGTVYTFSFACSPQSRLRCRRKEPCRLFTVKKRSPVEEVTANTLCQCPAGLRCPRHHTEPGVLPGTAYPRDKVRTYNGHCF